MTMVCACAVQQGPAEAPPVAPSVAESVALRGAWEDPAGYHRITDQMWIRNWGGAVYHIRSYDNEGQYLLAFNDEANPYDPARFSRIDWVADAEGDLWYCFTAWAAPRLADAAQVVRGDDSDPGARGCGGSSWSRLVRRVRVSSNAHDSGGAGAATR